LNLLHDFGLTPLALAMCGCCARYWVSSSRAPSSAALRSSWTEQTISCGRSMASMLRPARAAPRSNCSIASMLYSGGTQ
jgi:hypothetical protein